jgi:hypothetical protein
MKPKLAVRALSNNGLKSNYFIKGIPIVQLFNITSDYSEKFGQSALAAGHKKNPALPSSLSSFAEHVMFSRLAGSALIDFVALFLYNGVPWSVHLFACCPPLPFLPG